MSKTADIRRRRQVAKTAFRGVRAAERNYHAALKAAFPFGSEVTYQHGSHRVDCCVVGHYADRLRVIGVSGKEYWIDGARVLF